MIDVSDVLTDPDLTKQIPVVRSVESVDNNGRTTNTTTTLTVTGVVMPAEDKMLERLPEADRTNEVVAVYSTEQLTPGTPTLGADVVTWRGEQYRVVKVLDWMELGGICIALATAATMHGRELDT